MFSIKTNIYLFHHVLHIDLIKIVDRFCQRHSVQSIAAAVFGFQNRQERGKSLQETFQKNSLIFAAFLVILFFIFDKEFTWTFR